MLEVSRKREEVLVVRAWDSRGNPIEIGLMVTGIENGKVRLGINGPSCAKFLRAELIAECEQVPLATIERRVMGPLRNGE